VRYPAVLGEDATLDAALAGRSLARYGDGELKLILGANCISQAHDKALAAELAGILAEKNGEALACIPNVAATLPGKREGWAPYAGAGYTDLYSGGPYGSAFITRPDSAPWIDRPDYWAKVRSLWEGRDITLVLGTQRSLRPHELPGAGSVREVWGPRRDAYAEIDRIEDEIGKPSGPVLLCLGPSATVLAARLARKGVWALDLGHIGMFMRHAGSYAVAGDDLISPAYRRQLLLLRQKVKGWGSDGAKHAEAVDAYAAEIEAETVLDYGCGEQKLAQALKGRRRVMGYDPGIPGRDGQPKPADLVACTDVLEHVEPDKLDAVLHHLFRIAGRAAYVVISTRPARTLLPDGRNAHLLVKPASWWIERLASAGWSVVRQEDRGGKELRLWLRK
jgi:hypothetical protein